mgnify:CR=1 FL=1
MRGVESWIEVARVAIGREAAVEIAHSTQDFAKREEHSRVVISQKQCTAATRQRFVRLLEHHQCPGEVVMRLGVAWIEFRRVPVT